MKHLNIIIGYLCLWLIVPVCLLPFFNIAPLTGVLINACWGGFCGLFIIDRIIKHWKLYRKTPPKWID